MLFTQLEFIFFFMIVFGFFLVVRNNKLRKIALLASSYYFYAYWDFRFLGLVIISTVVDYLVGQLLAINTNDFRRKLLLAVSLIINLGILGVFKYYNFFVSSLQHLLEPTGFHLVSLDIILPIGISFYTFKTLSYTIEVYRRTIPACKSLFDYALFVAFFPTVLAGPIIRASHFLPQLKKTSIVSKKHIVLGLQLFIVGLFKKVFIADRLALFVDPFFLNAEVYSSATTWLAVCAYTLQIYFDFAGYSDMAIGVSKMIGYDVNINFDHPYLSKSIIEFWRRWHISLSTWIRDYIYIPLGGNRKGKIRTYVNLLSSMMLCGLWHGAAWTFVFWGLFHGIALSINRFLANTRKAQEASTGNAAMSSCVHWIVTILIVMIGWVFFRSKNFYQAIHIIGKMFFPEPGVSWYPPFVIFLLFGTGLIHILKALEFGDFHNLPIKAWYTPAMLFCMLWLVLIFYPKGFNPFIYFQF